MHDKPNKFSTNLIFASVLGVFLFLPQKASAQMSGGPQTFERMQNQAQMKIREKLSEILDKYCPEACQVMDVKIKLEETFNDEINLGFENMHSGDPSLYNVSDVVASIQIDNRITGVNRERLQKIIENNLSTSGYRAQIQWFNVDMPQIGRSLSLDSQVKRHLEATIEERIGEVINKYCPDRCILSRVDVQGTIASPDQVSGLPSNQIYRMPGSDSILLLENVDVELSLDNKISPAERARIRNLMRAILKFVSPVNFKLINSAFPEPLTEQERLEQTGGADPYGLNKLRETLKIFKELASTKEIITTEKVESTNKSQQSIQTTNNERNSSVEKNTLNTKESATSESTSAISNSINSIISEWGWLIGGALLLIVLVAFLVKYNGAQKDAKIMMEVASRQIGREGASAGNHNGENGENPEALTPIERNKKLSLRLQVQGIKDELAMLFLDNPKIAKETYGRLIQEEGIDKTAKYVHLFGHSVVNELITDPNFQRDLFELTEFYQKSTFNFSLEEELELLNELKTKVTASEIRVLSRKTMEVFDFLLKLDAARLYNLIAHEKPVVQSICLTQLDPKRRREVFEMFEGDAKIKLLKELCRAEAFTKDYLYTVGMALQKKVTSSPEFDTQNLRTTDILFELLEKSNFEEQRALMTSLVATNPEAARSIKLKLVTLEVLMYLKDGQILEIVLGIDRADILVFLRGTKDYVRDLIFSKVPEELAMSWNEELMNLGMIDEQAYKLGEMRIFSKIRHLASNGMINLIAINDILFAEPDQLLHDSNNMPPLERSNFVA